ncbi:hypothetical protein BSNT_10141 [Bacillus subtilis subsp. natto BEST195]|nr:hypothetical protein BSNT_10141 [Bacillus subtilis subsp. natto BEST195]
MPTPLTGCAGRLFLLQSFCDSQGITVFSKQKRQDIVI